MQSSSVLKGLIMKIGRWIIVFVLVAAGAFGVRLLTLSPVERLVEVSTIFPYLSPSVGMVSTTSHSILFEFEEAVYEVDRHTFGNEEWFGHFHKTISYHEARGEAPRVILRTDKRVTLVYVTQYGDALFIDFEAPRFARTRQFLLEEYMTKGYTPFI